jgi:hypothetical protein
VLWDLLDAYTFLAAWTCVCLVCAERVLPFGRLLRPSWVVLLHAWLKDTREMTSCGAVPSRLRARYCMFVLLLTASCCWCAHAVLIWRWPCCRVAIELHCASALGRTLHCAHRATEAWNGVAQPHRVCLAKVLEFACCRAFYYFDVAVTR